MGTLIGRQIPLPHGEGRLACNSLREVGVAPGSNQLCPSGALCSPQACSDHLLTSSDPVEAFLLDAKCVRRWVRELLALSCGCLVGWLAPRPVSAALPAPPRSPVAAAPGVDGSVREQPRGFIPSHTLQSW